MTDHSGGGRDREILKPDLNLPYALARPLAEELGILLVPGVEVAQGLTHCNALFIKDANEVEGLDLAAALRKLHAQGAFIPWNHPGWRRAAQWYPDIAAAHQEGLIQGMEIVNDSETYPETFGWVEEKKPTLFSNSDVHGAMAPQSANERRQVTLVFAASAAWYRNDVWGAEAYLRGLWQGAVKIEPTRLSLSTAKRRSGVRLQNSSAIPFRVRVQNSPAWLEFGAGEIPVQLIVNAAVSIAKNAPVGDHRVELELEITNLHVAPGRNLIVRLPLRVTVTP